MNNDDEFIDGHEEDEKGDDELVGDDEESEDSEESLGAFVDELREDFAKAIATFILSLGARGKAKIMEFMKKIESKEISEFPLDPNLLSMLNETGLPLTKKDMLHESGNQAVFLSKKDFDILGSIDFITSKGERMVIESDSLDDDDVFVLYPNEVGNEDPAKKKKPAEQKKPKEVLNEEIRLKTILFEIFGGATFGEPVEKNEAWEEIMANKKLYMGDIVRLSRAKEVPAAYLDSYAYTHMLEWIEKGVYDIPARQIRNFKFGTPEQQDAFEAVVAEINPDVRKEREERLESEEARFKIQEAFADVQDQDSIVAELPDFWNEKKDVTSPAGVIIDGRAKGIPERHLRRFAFEILEGELKKKDYAWIARFLKSMRLASDETIAFFEALAAKKQK